MSRFTVVDSLIDTDSSRSKPYTDWPVSRCSSEGIALCSPVEPTLAIFTARNRVEQELEIAPECAIQCVSELQVS